MDFRTRLREQIEFSGLLDKEVASKAKISKRAIDSYVGVQGCIPSADVAVRLAKVLNTTVEYLMTGSNPTNTVTNEKKINIIKSRKSIVIVVLSVCQLFRKELTNSSFSVP